MNRIQDLIDQQLGPALVSTMPMAEPARGAEDAHCIFAPMHYEPNYAYPLVVWLHGPDDDEHQVTRVMPHVSLRNYVAVGPRGTRPSAEVDGGYGWSQSPWHVAEAHERIMASITAARRDLNICPERIFVAGFRCGGTMALRVALDHPQMFAGVLSIYGAFPHTSRPLAQLQAARRLKIVLATGSESRNYPPEQLSEDLRLFHAANLSVRIWHYLCGDDLMTDMLSDMDRWIMQQFTATWPLDVRETRRRFGAR
jgi:phospholipase/carboxylesterase